MNFVRNILKIHSLLVLLLMLFQQVISVPEVAYAERPKAAGNGFALVEFFTSENCIWCKNPSALASKIESDALRSGKDVFLLSYHVDYLGAVAWKDVFARSEFSDRQREYNIQLRKAKVLPGQMIINGSWGSPGNKTKRVLGKIAQSLQERPTASLSMKATLANDGSGVDVSFRAKGLSRLRRPYFFFQLALVESGTIRPITQGPNTGYTFRHTNTVRDFSSSRFAKSMRGNRELVFPKNLQRDKASLIGFIQDPKTWNVLAAKRIFLSELSKE